MATPAVEYKSVGKYEHVGDLECYITGDGTSDRAIINILDAFGFRLPTLRGVDLLAASVPYLVVMPDILKGDPADPDWFTTDTKEKAQALERFKPEEKAQAPERFEPKAYNARLEPMILRSAADATLRWPSVRAWAWFGLGWGGKSVAQISRAGSPFKASGQAYPSQPSREDAEKTTIPHLCLASSGEVEKIKQYEEVFCKSEFGGEMEVYGSMARGWMGTKSNLKDAYNIREFERKYQQVARFFASYL